jgi:hypothetical protein
MISVRTLAIADLVHSHVWGMEPRLLNPLKVKATPDAAGHNNLIQA